MSDDFRVDKVRGHKPSSHEPEEDDSNKESKLGHIFGLILHKVIPGFTKKKFQTHSLDDTMLRCLTEIRKHLLMLRENDFSKDPGFTTAFSKHWNLFMDQFYTLKRTDSNYNKIHDFIIHMNGYPKQASHSLAYYLTNYAGEKWLPLPYLDILRKLNRDFLIQGNESDLSQFLRMLGQILGEEN